MKNIVSILLILFFQSAKAQCGHVVQTHFIYSLHGVIIPDTMLFNLQLTDRQVLTNKYYNIYECKRVYYKKTGILLYENKTCVDTMFRIMYLKSDIEVGGKVYTRRIDKIAVLSQLKPSDIISIENFPPQALYKGKLTKNEVLKFNIM